MKRDCELTLAMQVYIPASEVVAESNPRKSLYVEELTTVMIPPLTGGLPSGRTQNVITVNGMLTVAMLNCTVQVSVGVDPRKIVSGDGVTMSESVGTGTEALINMIIHTVLDPCIHTHAHTHTHTPKIVSPWQMQLTGHADIQRAAGYSRCSSI